MQIYRLLFSYLSLAFDELGMRERHTYLLQTS